MFLYCFGSLKVLLFFSSYDQVRYHDNVFLFVFSIESCHICFYSSFINKY